MKAVLLALVTCTALCAGEKRRPASPAYHRQQTVSTPEGDFLFFNFQIQKQIVGSELQGNVRNGTAKAWTSASFNFYWKTPSGETIDHLASGLPIRDLQPGEIRRVTIPLTFAPNGIITGYRFEFRDGEFPVTYIVEMLEEGGRLSPLLNQSRGCLEWRFDPGPKTISAQVINACAGPITIDWNKSAFVDLDGETVPLLHDLVRGSDASAVKPPSVLATGAKITRLVFPSTNLKFDNGWRVRNFLPQGPQSAMAIGKRFQLIFAVDDGGGSRFETFKFQVR